MPALLLHGAGAGGWEWNVWRRVFAAVGIASVAPDLQPGAAGLEATTLDDYVEQALAAARAMAAPRALVGASLGGWLALAVAARIDCAALVLVNPLPPLPEAAELPVRPDYPQRVPWARDASLAGTRRALPDADAATAAHAWRRWRDESGQVLNAARAGRELPPPACPTLVLASVSDAEVPVEVSATLADRLGATFLRVSGSHVAPLLGRGAAAAAGDAVRWLSAQTGFRTR